MKKLMLFPLILCLPACVQAFPGTLDMTRKDGLVTRSLVLSNWQVDKRGVPTFDYQYKQSGPGCDYVREGHAIAEFDEMGDSVELTVMNPQGADGKDGPPITLFSDRVHKDVVFQVSQAKKGKVNWVGFSDEVMMKTTRKECGFTEKNASVMFKNKK